MGERVRVFQVDAFTSQRFCGNPAGVVLDADALSEADMRALARELNNGDTAFLLQPDGPDHDLRVRFFTPRSEAAFVGHATLAAHAVLATLQLPPRPRQKQKSGLVQIDTLSALPPRIAIRQSAPRLGRPLEPREILALLGALGLVPADLDRRCPPMIAGESSQRVLLGVNAVEVLDRARPDRGRLCALSAESGVPGYFLFALSSSATAPLTEARMFCPALGIDEDPVSGNAHALLGAYLLRHALLAPPTLVAAEQIGIIEFAGVQGRSLGRAGRVDVRLELERGALRSVSIAGEAVIVFATSVDFP
jgi:PhzF family phenazine biosynthesis protein